MGVDLDRDRRQPPPDTVCPFLGDPEQPAVRPLEPAIGLMCHAGRRAYLVDRSKQRHLCLNAGHTACALYRQGVSSRRDSRPWAMLDTEGWIAEPSPEQRDQQARERIRRRLDKARGRRLLPFPIPTPDPRLVLLGGAIIVIVVAVFLAINVINSLLGGSVPAPTASPTVSASIPGSAASDLPTAEPSAVATPTPSPTQDPNGILYIVKKNDTLYAIALKFHTSAAAIAAANGIADPRKLHTGQQLVIPP